MHHHHTFNRWTCPDILLCCLQANDTEDRSASLPGPIPNVSNVLNSKETTSQHSDSEDEAPPPEAGTAEAEPQHGAGLPPCQHQSIPYLKAILSQLRGPNNPLSGGSLAVLISIQLQHSIVFEPHQEVEHVCAQQDTLHCNRKCLISETVWHSLCFQALGKKRPGMVLGAMMGVVENSIDACKFGSASLAWKLDWWPSPAYLHLQLGKHC